MTKGTRARQGEDAQGGARTKKELDPSISSGAQQQHHPSCLASLHPAHACSLGAGSRTC